MRHAQTLPLWSIASPVEIERTARDLTRVRERFLACAEPDRAGALRPLIRRSWERCLDMCVDASRRLAPLTVTREAQIAELRGANEPLLRAGRGAVQRLADHLAGSGYVVVLADARGNILDVSGDPAVRRRLARIDFIAGGDWSERAAGTNAIGTALADRHAVQLMGAEHFCDGWTDLTCTAAPIRNPLTGAIVGVLDITGDYRLIRAHLTSLLAMSALDIEEHLRALLAPPASGPSTAPAAPRDERRAANDSVLLTIAGGAVSASLDVMSTLRSIAEQTAILLHVGCTGVFLFDSAASEARFARSSVNESREISRSALSDLLAACVAMEHVRERGEPIVADDVTRDERFGCARSAVGSIALLPLATPRGITGFVVAARPEPGSWSVVELRRIFALMSQASTAIENALLFESVRRQYRHTEALNAISQLLRELPDGAANLAPILDAIVRVMECTTGALWISRGTYRACVHGASPSALARRAAAAGTMVHDHRDGGDDALAVPLLDDDGAFGVLELRRSARPLDPVDIDTIAAIARQLGMSMQYADLQRAAREIDVLRRADRLKSDFLSTVSHDLRSPLTAIRASVDGLLDRPGSIAIATDAGFLHTISNQVNRLTRLVDQLLDISQIEAGGFLLDREWNELPAMIAYAVDELAALHGSLRIEYRIPRDVPALYVDHDRIIQVLYNLVDNACKHGRSPHPITIEADWTATKLTLGIADRGRGLGGERDAIFRRFHRGSEAKHVVRGIGLGLAICRGIIEAHGGSIWAENRPAGGAVFRFTIPITPGAACEPVP